MIRVGVIGLGIAGRRHLAAYASHPAAHIGAISDTRPEAAEGLSREYGAPWFRDYRELMRQELDAVSICLPHAHLAEVAIAASEHKLHTLLEKPMATSVRDAVAIRQAFLGSGCVIMIGYVHRFREEVIRARKLIQEGMIGENYLIVERSSLGGDARAPRWIWDPEISGGGVLMYNGVHCLDRLLWITDATPARVKATVRTLAHRARVEDLVLATIEFSPGPVAELMIHFPPAEQGSHWHTEFYGTEGALSLRTGSGLDLVSKHGNQTFVPQDDNRFEREIDEFLGSIQDSHPASPGADDGCRILQLVEAIYASAGENGRWVELKHISPR